MIFSKYQKSSENKLILIKTIYSPNTPRTKLYLCSFESTRARMRLLLPCRDKRRNHLAHLQIETDADFLGASDP